VFDLSKNLVTQETLDLLVAFARQQDVKKNFAAQFAGEKMNASENHAVLHTALRTDDAPAEVHETLARMKKLSTSIRADKSIRDVVHIGIGGSDLGPRMVCAALPASGPRVHFVASVDPHDLQTALKDAKPESTLVIAVSKTFTSQETIINLHAARTWLKNDSRVIAVTANESAAKGEGIRAENILPMWDWVGGRFSVWSAVGLSVAISAGFDAFEQLLAGARRADSHVSITPLDKNIPVLMALLTIWYRNFLKYAAMAVVPYGDALALLPSYLQQLEMESNGKRIDRQGNLCTYETAPVTFGMVGPNAQHAFMQMIHQGTGIIPCDFIGVADAHPILMANMKAQAQALMRGRHTDAAHAACPGNRPSTTITLPRLDPASLGLLLAIEEHKTAALGYLWNINSFDQFGVELGKTLAKELLAR
jgi:glucose-6-phosphate isomerase